MTSLVPFLLLLFIIAAILRIDFFFTIIYLFFGVYFFSRLWVTYTLRHVSARRRFTGHAFPGDEVTVELTLQNTGRLPIPWLELHEALPVALTAPPYHREVVAFGPHQRHRIQYKLQCRQRGYYTIGPLAMETGDLLGVLGQRQAQVGKEHIIVYPRVVALEELGLPTHAPLAALPAPMALFDDPARIMGVREYQRGDSPRRIHWLASATAGRLLVKQYEPAIARETIICLDLDREDYGQRQRYVATELAIVAAASIANHIVMREGLPVGLATEALDPLTDERARFVLPPRSERDHLMGLLEVLARVQIASEAPFSGFLRQASVRFPWGTTLVVITGRESAELFETLAYLKQMGFALALVLVQPAHAAAALHAQIAALGLPVHRIWREQDLEAVA